MLSASDSGCIQSSSRAMVSEQSTSNQPRATVATEAKGKGEGIAPLNPTIFTIGLSIGGIDQSRGERVARAAEPNKTIYGRSVQRE